MTDVMELFRLYHDDVYRLAVSFTHSKQDAEDISQNVFLKLMGQTDIAPGKEKAWLMQVTANECRSLLRSVWWKRTEGLDELLPAVEKQDDFLVTIAKLKPRYHVVIYLYYYEEYSTEKIAAILKVSRSVVTTRLSRSRKLLREDMMPSGDVSCISK